MNYKKYCWYCGDSTMKPVGSYYQCSSCGATYCDFPKRHRLGLVVESNPATLGTKYRPRARRQPRQKVASS